MVRPHTARARAEAAAAGHSQNWRSFLSAADEAMLREWEMSQTTRPGAYEDAMTRLDPQVRAAAEAARLTAATQRTENRRQQWPGSSSFTSSRVWYGRPKRQVKDDFIGLTRSPSCELGWPEVKRECPVCAHRWLDKYAKDECPKCLTKLDLPDWQRYRRLPGETSTFKEPPGSAMESESGHCRKGGMHLWRYGRCAKCGRSEGSEKADYYAEQRMSQPSWSPTSPNVYA